MEPNFKSQEVDYQAFKFPSGEVQVQLLNINVISSYKITGSILTSDHLMELLQLVEAIRYHGKDFPIHLVMPYCAYSRQDRRCNTGESFSLKIFTDLINSCNFSSVTTHDNHSDVSTALINNCTNISVKDVLEIVEANCIEMDITNYDFFISPDAGANKKIQECSEHFDIPMIRADKVRDTKTGAIVETKIFTKPYALSGTKVLIIDDIAQGGRTFEELAKAVHKTNLDVQVDLFVTHGFFNKGFTYMQEAGITNFYSTNSIHPVKSSNAHRILDIK